MDYDSIYNPIYLYSMQKYHVISLLEFFISLQPPAREDTKRLMPDLPLSR